MRAPSPPPSKDAAQDWSASVQTNLSDILGRGGRLALIAAGVFALWAATAPLSSAVVAPAALMAQGNNKVLQHRAGGVLREILAAEGDVLRAGQEIAVLSPEIDRAQLTRLRAQQAKAKAQKARLDAEKRYFEPDAGEPLQSAARLRGSLSPGTDGDAAMAGFDLEMDGETASLLGAEQKREYEKGRAAIRAELEGLAQRAKGLERQQKGLADREGRVVAQLALLGKQRQALAELVGPGYVAKRQLWEMDAQLLQREAELDEIRAQHDVLTNSIGETHAQLDRARSSDEQRTSEALTEVLAEIAELDDQIRAAELALADSVVRAPVEGTLVHSKLTTVGGVVTPGEVFGEIVPSGSGLQVEARIAQHDITDVHVGQSAKMTVSALNSRLYDAVPAQIVYVAADATTDERTGERYFEARAQLEGVPTELQTVLKPGMAGQVQIEGPSRTFFGYLIRPLRDSFSRTFKEQR